MDNNDILNQIIQVLLPILATFLTGVCTYVANRLKNVLEEKTNTQIAKTVVEDAVKFVEQVYTDLHGQEKLEKATEQITEVLRAKGISLTEAEIYMLIESAVYGLNEGWFKSEENKSIPAETEDKEETVVEEDKAE